MLSLYNIWNVARIETKTLLRSWFFRIFAILSVIILIFFNIGILTNAGKSPWMFRGIPASIPYMNLLMLNVVQAAIAVFLASDFLKRDKKLDTTEVVYMRSLANGDYVLGKTLGILLVFMALNVIVLLVALIFNIFFTDVALTPVAYLLYPLVISLPTLVFIFGLSFLFMVTIQNQPVTFIVLLGYIALTVFFLNQKFYHLFDYMSFYVPLMYSEFVGFGDLTNILIHRGIYFFLGLGFIFLTILMIKRLPQSVVMTNLSRILAFLFIFMGLGFGVVYVINFSSGKTLRSQMVELNDRYFSEAKVSPVRTNLTLNHSGNEISCSAGLLFKNESDQPVTKYIFRLNPGLEISRISNGKGQIPFKRNLHVIEVQPAQPLAPGMMDSLQIAYHGAINERACYLDVDEETREEPFRYFLFQVKKRYSFIEPDYLLLSPEANWYPEPGINYSSKHPEIHEQNFTKFSLTVKTQPGLLPVSQGKREESGEGEYKFAPQVPLPGLSLVAGKYKEKSISVDSVAYHVYFLNGHDYFTPYLSEISDTLAALIRSYKKDYEVDLDLPYLYPDLNLVETPIQLFSYKRFWTEAQETVQPEMVLLPELGVLLSSGDFKQFLSWQKRRQKRSNVVETPREIQSNMFQRFVRDTFLGGQGMNRFRGGAQLKAPVYYKIFPNYFTFVNYIDAPKWPIFDVAMESYLASRVTETRMMGFRFMEGLSSQEKTNIELSDKSLPELLADPDKKEVIPDIIKEKGNYLFTLLQNRVGEERFPAFLSKILSENHFKTLPVNRIIATLKKEFNFNLTPYIENWYASAKLPAFLIGNIRANQVLDGERTRYQVRFKISNIESVPGLVEVSFRMGRRGRFGMGGSSDNEVKRIINMEAGQNKEIGIILDYQPRVMTINTFISRNLPATITKMFDDLKLDKKVKLFDGEKIVDSPVVLQVPGEIIVDNEDPGFTTFSTASESFIKRIFKISGKQDSEKYIGLTFWRPPKQWRATIHANFYGRLVKSGYFIRSGDGSKKVAWNAKIPASGYYDIYYHASKISMPWMRRNRGGNAKPESEQYHFKIYHDDGEDDTILNMGNAENDWVFLGSYYISAGDAKVELTNESKARIVYADAVKWVKRQ